ncbi:hypothetical protein [Acinetobacter ursingii]|uniref:hypothetical protein n=1 Tax=Acinetobacter ursingii TaxID=108980 RepID=UPI003AF97B7D
MSNLTEHKCKGKCPEFKTEQCNHCLVQQIEKREFELGVAPEDAYVKTNYSEIPNNSDFVIGDVVVSILDAVIPELFEVCEQPHKSYPEFVMCKPMNHEYKCWLAINEIRSATPAELHARKRLSADLNKHLDSALIAQGEVA